MPPTKSKPKVPPNAFQLGTVQLQSGSYVAMGVVGPYKPPPPPPIHEGDFLHLGLSSAELGRPTNVTLTAAPPIMPGIPLAGGDLRQLPVGNPPIPPVPPIIPIPPWLAYVIWTLISNVVKQVSVSGHGERFQANELEKALTTSLRDTGNQLAGHYPEQAEAFQQLANLQVKLKKV